MQTLRLQASSSSFQFPVPSSRFPPPSSLLHSCMIMSCILSHASSVISASSGMALHIMPQVSLRLPTRLPRSSFLQQLKPRVLVATYIHAALPSCTARRKTPSRPSAFDTPPSSPPHIHPSNADAQHASWRIARSSIPTCPPRSASDAPSLSVHGIPAGSDRPRNRPLVPFSHSLCVTVPRCHGATTSTPRASTFPLSDRRTHGVNNAHSPAVERRTK